jgi:gluconolactonase
MTPGATLYRNQLVFTGEGQGNNTAPALYVMNPRPPYNTTRELLHFFLARELTMAQSL